MSDAAMMQEKKLSTFSFTNESQLKHLREENTNNKSHRKSSNSFRNNFVTANVPKLILASEIRKLRYFTLHFLFHSNNYKD